jgi:Sin3 associated polypeptide p18 (SAP18)
MLVRLFCREGGFHAVEVFRTPRMYPQSDEVITYTWYIMSIYRIYLYLYIYGRFDATLKELSLLIQEVYPDARHLDVHFQFRLVYVTPDGPASKDLGTVSNGALSVDADRSLRDCNFIQGDVLDVAIRHTLQ